MNIRLLIFNIHPSVSFARDLLILSIFEQTRCGSVETPRFTEDIP